MIKPASAIRTTIYLAAFAILFLPYKFIQAIAISILLIFGISFLWAKQLDKHLTVERTIREIKTVSFERLTISFTVKNKSRFPALLCYVLDNVPFLHVFDKKNERIFRLRSFEQKTIFYEVNALNRGLYTAGPILIKTTDPLGLFQVVKEIESLSKETVLISRTFRSTVRCLSSCVAQSQLTPKIRITLIAIA